MIPDAVIIDDYEDGYDDCIPSTIYTLSDSERGALAAFTRRKTNSRRAIIKYLIDYRLREKQRRIRHRNWVRQYARARRMVPDGWVAKTGMVVINGTEYEYAMSWQKLLCTLVPSPRGWICGQGQPWDDEATEAWEDPVVAMRTVDERARRTLDEYL